jgi:hypothetical protein
MSELNQLIDPPKKKKLKPKNYADLCIVFIARVGDVVYLPSNVDTKMTVAIIHHLNPAAGHYDQMITVQFLNINQELQTIKLDARTLVR